MKTLKKILRVVGILFLLLFMFNSIKIYSYSNEYSEEKSDVAIVLGAGTEGGELSPIFKERVNHGIYLYDNKIVEKIIFTGGTGEEQTLADSEIAKSYAIELGVPQEDILIEVNSQYTFENLLESKKIMDLNALVSALIISDPLHMKRSIELANSIDIECKPSPTSTSMYRSNFPKFKSLMYETFFYTLGKISFSH
ncbi:MAG: YdcF family protein [Crocinitomix sp.]|nr:YdcF family protein [Crocinitomix sp.]